MLTRAAKAVRTRRAAGACFPNAGGELKNRMRETFTSGSVGRAPGYRCLYPEEDRAIQVPFGSKYF